MAAQPSSPIRFDGRVALVTGAGRGLGAAYARLLAARGASVVVHDAGVSLGGSDTDRSVASAVVEEIRSAGGEAVAAFDDLSDGDAADRIVAMALDRYERLDVLVSNAGLLAVAPIEETGDDQLRRFVAVTVEAPYRLCRAAFPVMKRHGYGRVVLTASGRAMYIDAAMSGLSAYALGKGSQLGLMVALAAEGEPSGIRVNAVSPVATTRMTLQPVPPGEMEADQVAPGVAFLASEACDFSGVVLRAAGGRFSVARWAFSQPVDLGSAPAPPEEVAAGWSQIAAATGDPGADPEAPHGLPSSSGRA